MSDTTTEKSMRFDEFPIALSGTEYTIGDAPKGLPKDSCCSFSFYSRNTKNHLRGLISYGTDKKTINQVFLCV
ncbi:hypothetical protein AX774_g2787 [Zancudomyces culisetae]|uniref:Uncharacterized protein n=1 Tax=Zancudomyces culisetae TaxID=1213189 RepID=A0A1R1PRY4_ZANCU|nr:hypothetical protein AX774_g2787 [Zancudomyces culisetae]|eukprot:OMH83711.1 hypothetical protein AX774_g2787 [Zancudomyces culisetae]